MKWPNKHKAQVKYTQHILKACTLFFFLKMQRRIIVSLTTCPQVPPGSHFDLGNFISQLRQIETHRGVDGSEGEEDEEDESCSAELCEGAPHSSKRLAHHQKTLNWSFDPRCLPGDVGGIHRGWTWLANETDVIRQPSDWMNGAHQEHRSDSWTAPVWHLSIIQIDFWERRFNFWVTLLLSPKKL